MTPIDNRYELLQNAPTNTKVASKGWIRNEDQYKVDLSHMNTKLLKLEDATL
jgi:hypothetical protein